MRQQINVLYVVSRLLRSGPTRQLLNIVHQVKQHGICPVVATLSPEPPDSLITEFADMGVHIQQLQRSRWFGVLSVARDLRQICRRHDIQIVHTQGIRADTASAISRAPAVRVATIRNVPWLDYRMTYGDVVGAVMASWHRTVLTRLDAVVAVSSAVVKQLRLRNTVVVRNGVDTSYFQAVRDEERIEARTRLGIPDAVRVLISVGHLSKRKDPATLIEAFRRASGGTPALLILVGDGPERTACAENTGSNIKLVGRQQDVRSFLAAADLFVSASRAEGFPNAALEAAAMGLPLILSDIAPHVELVRAAALRARLFAVGDVNDLGAALRECIESKGLCGLGNREGIVKALSKQHMGQQYADLYAQLVELQRSTERVGVLVD